MTAPSDDEAGRQRIIDAHFRDHASDWQRIYGAGDVNALVHRERLERALSWIDDLGLPRGTRVLDLGCGAGPATVALAQRGFRVSALDPVPDMVELTRRAAGAAGVADRVAASTGDAHALPFEDGTYGLVVALGVFPFLHTPLRAAHEIARVLQPNGYLVTNADNSLRAIRFLEPMQSKSLRRAVRRASGRTARDESLPASMQSIRAFDSILAAAGFEKLAGRTLGFGPFTFLRRPLLSDPAARRLHRRLQSWADERRPVVRSMGAQYLVLARRRAS